jgi:NAD(P)H-hydrate epimerase
MKLISVAQAREIDRVTIERHRVPAIILMENAGMAVADQISGDNILVLCGKGNNGGDGSVAARHLYARGKNVVLCYAEIPTTGDAETAYQMARDFGVPIKEWTPELPQNCEIVVDALLGIGAVGAPSPDLAAIIGSVNDAGKTVYAVDVPSGGNADTGWIEGACIRADYTVTFGFCKIGLACYPLRKYAGAVAVRGISFAPGLVTSNVQTIQPTPLPPIPPNRHKGVAGKVFVLAGSKGFTGAAYLNSMAAMRAGCGVATLGIPDSLNAVMEQKLTEVMTLPLPDRNGVLTKDATNAVLSASNGYDAIVCGSGLGQSEDVDCIVTALIRRGTVPMVLDADGLTALARHTDILREKQTEIILTPHIGEMARLIGKSVEFVERDTVAVAQTFAAEYHVIVVLKSAHTVVAMPDKAAYIGTAGNGGMATAGSGDVLAGIIGSFRAQGMRAQDSAVQGVRIHGEAGDRAAAEVGERAMIAGDILEQLKVKSEK